LILLFKNKFPINHYSKKFPFFSKKLAAFKSSKLLAIILEAEKVLPLAGRWIVGNYSSKHRAIIWRIVFITCLSI
jgi:hypothetical protein